MLIIFDLDDTLYDRTGQMPDNYTEEDIQKITPFPQVKEFFQSFSGRKILVTRETDPGLQSRKIHSLGLQSYFDQIIVCHSDGEKKNAFQDIKQSFPGEEIIVVGDRIDLEIKYGKELGLKTVWLRHGNHKERLPREFGEVPDYVINEFSELPEILPG
jgi:FMN phosphatase YigB (HAD superfamily)